MSPAATRSRAAPTLPVAFELGNTEWKLAMTTRLDGPPIAPVRSGYEAGRDGFWLHRYLVSRGVMNSIVDSSSITATSRVIGRTHQSVFSQGHDR